MSISVVPGEPHHYERIVDYFVNGDSLFLHGMGVDPRLLPSREVWLQRLSKNHERPISQRDIFYVIWYLDGAPIGHSNVNKIIFEQEAYMHLHMWQPQTRKHGLGLRFVKQSIPHYFKNFRLKNLYCEPYAHNAAPNKTLRKLGFTFVKEYETVPGPISYVQPVNRWCLSDNDFHRLFRDT